MSIVDVVKRKLKEREDRKTVQSAKDLRAAKVERIRLEGKATIARKREVEESRIKKAKATLAKTSGGGVTGFLQGLAKGMDSPKRRGKRSTRGLENGFDSIGSNGGFAPPRFEDPFAPPRRKGKKGIPKFKEPHFY